MFCEYIYTIVGLYVGATLSAYYVTLIISSSAWGRISDLIGRRIPLLIGMICGITGLACLGFSSSYTIVILSRVIAALCVTPVICKAYIGEVTQAGNQHKGFAIVAMTVGLSGIISPLIGANLINPAETLGWTDPFWIEYAFLLPCLCGMIFCTIAFTYAFFFLPETEKWKARKAKKDAEEARRRKIDSEYIMLAQKENTKNGSSDYPDHTSLAEEEDPNRDVHEINDDTVNCYCLNKLMPAIARTRTITLAISLASMHAMITIIDATLFSVFCEAELWNGGLGLSVANTGTLLSIKGGMALFYTGLIYPRIGGHFGARTAVITGLSVWAMVLAAIPTTHYVAINNPDLAWAMIIGVECVTALIGSTTTIALMMVINNSCDPRVLGQVNGIGQSCQATLRTFGPTFAGSLWTWGVGLDVPYGGSLVYWTVSFLTLLAAGVATKLPLSINIPMSKRGKKGRPMHKQMISKSS